MTHVNSEPRRTRPTVVALGPLGTYTHQAAKQYFGEDAHYRLESTIEAVFKAVETSEDAIFGVCPIRNSTNGDVIETRECIQRYRPLEVDRLTIRIGHALLRKKGATGPIERVYSHEQGLGQCKAYIARKYPQAKPISVNSTSLAAQMAADDPSCLAISSLMCAELYELNIVDREIQDGEANQTTFVVYRKAGPSKAPVA